MNNDALPSIPPPPPAVEPERVFTSTQVITLYPHVTEEVFGIPITLLGFNHKFQDSADAKEWVELSAERGDLPQKQNKLNLGVSVFFDEQGRKTVYHENILLGKYFFEIRNINYNISAELFVGVVAV